jgi:hypothetical protein
MDNSVAVIMCTWKRVECFSKTLDLLVGQRNQNFEFFVFNNNPEIRGEIDLICNAYKDRLRITVRHSDKNIGGFGRFMIAKDLIGVYDKAIFIDDDQVFSRIMIDRFLQEYESNAIKSRWAFRFNNSNYTSRYQMLDSNEDVHYCGTGGMIAPMKVFKCEEVYKIPEEFLFVEDLWLCFVANHYLQYNLKSIRSDFIEQISDGKDQSTIGFLNVKIKLLNYLISTRGWKILKS